MNEIVIKIEGLEDLTKAVQALTSVRSEPGVQVKVPSVTSLPVQPAPAPQVGTMSVQPVPQMPVAQPAQVQVPTTVPVTQAPGSMPIQVPTTAAPQQYSFDQLAVALSNLCTNAGKQPEVHTLLNQFGVTALFDLPKERYGEFATALRGIGGVI